MNTKEEAKNVFGESLECCSCKEGPKTGYFRDGFCNTGPFDTGKHIVCADVTKEFLEFSKSKGNDLMTPRPEFSFPGLKPGDRWCLCVSRWMEAEEKGCAPPIHLSATHINTLDYVPMEKLKKYALDIVKKIK